MGKSIPRGRRRARTQFESLRRMTLHTFRILLGGLGLSAVAACAADSVQAPSSTVDVGAALAQARLGSLASYNGAAAALGVASTSAAPTLSTSSCTFSDAMQGFTCPAKTAGGLTFTTSYFLYDAAGQPQSSSSGDVAAVRAVVDANGTVTHDVNGGTVSAVVAHHSDMRVDGLIAGPRIVHGTSIDHDELTTSGSTSAQTVIDMTSTTTNLVLPSATSKWPQAGAIVGDATVVTTLGELPPTTTKVHSVLTFDGSSTATLVATVSGHTTTCAIDLTGQNGPVCH
jgi:hypothetical protein